ncbi:monoamine oxidase [Cohnella pontilimi]|uniref:Monoamine oxidase n=1 Tax=Cohnella pontilimi TaxID=2564100 RepID=A0A4U0F8S3_9BACL|nr:FAD-dependent oxidoreductase [Cohnella pontilimi]TJY41075.1 monoamine oxidase [Cohnella pontilimi]
MARTPLFRRLKDAVSVAGEAAEKDIPVEQVIRERTEKSISRKQFLQKAAIATVAAAIPDFVWKLNDVFAGDSSEPGRIVVIGAGLSGLTCAYQLKKAGYTAEIYEASERAGGRCWTRRGDFENGQIAEHGGEFIDTNHKELLQLVKEFGLTLDDVVRAQPAGTEELYYFDGSPYSFAEACKDFKAIWNTLHTEALAAGYPTLYNRYTARGRELDQMSIVDWIKSKIPGGMTSRLGKLIDVAYNIEYGAESTDQSALNMIYLLAYSNKNRLEMFGESDETYHVRGGNDQIVSKLVEALNDQIVYRTRLTAIKQNKNGGYTLTLQTGSSSRQLYADKVVLTLPFSILRSSVDYQGAGFRPLKKTAIQEQGMGTNSKLHVQFRTRHWEQLGCNGGTYADTGYQNTWDVTRAQPGETGILVNYTGGVIGASFDKGNPESRAKQFLSQLEPVLPGVTAKWNGLATLDYWTGYRWTLGSYSYWKVGQYTKFVGIEREKEGGCYFAGEHTSVDFQGYLNGAVESGQRAANEILADLKASGIAEVPLQQTI